MNRRILSIGCILLLLLPLSGCRLAREDGQDIEGDRLVGVFITREYLDLFDMEGYLQDNISKIMNGGEITVENEAKFNGRIYAELKSRTLTNPEGSAIETWEYVFENIEGIPFFMAEYRGPDGEISRGPSTGGAVSDVSIIVGDKDSLEGTVYITPDFTDVVYINPVYQSSDGQGYVTSGSGFSHSGNNYEGTAFSTTHEETRTVTKNGEKTEESFKITVHIAVKYPFESMSILHMSAENIPVSRESYIPGSLPENVTVSPEAEYLIVETRVDTPDGEMLRREIQDREDQYLTAYTARPDGILEAKTVTIQWE